MERVQKPAAYQMKFTKLFICLILSLACVAAQEVAEAEATEEAATEGTSSVDDTTAAVADDEQQANESSAPEEPFTNTEGEEVPPPEKTDDEASPELQQGPFIDLLGPTLLSIEMTSPTSAQLKEELTNDALRGKKVVGLYFSADWCGPCRQFTPELVKFYEKVNKRRKDDFQIVWISRCRDVQSYGQYFTEMKWLAIPPQEAMGERGQLLGEKYGVKSIPSLVLLDDVGNLITKDARNQIPKDKAGIGFPWRNPLSTLYITVVPKTFRHMIKSHVADMKSNVMKRIQSVLRPAKKAAA